MAGDFLPLPRIAMAILVHQMLRQQAIKIAKAVIIPAREVAVPGTRLLHFQIVHDDLLAGVNAQLVLPAHPDVAVLHRDFLLLRRAGKRPIRARKTLDAENLFAYAVMAPLAYFLGEMTALVHKFDGHRQFHAISKFQLAVKHQFVQLLPDFIAVRSAADDALFDAPCFPEVAEAHDLVLHAVILRVNASSQHQNTLRQFCGIFLPAAQHGILVLHIATVFPK